MPKEEPPPPKPDLKGHEKMVDLDNDKEVEPPVDPFAPRAALALVG